MKTNNPRIYWIQNPHLEFGTWTNVSAFEPEVNPSIIDEVQCIEYSAYEAEREKVRRLTELVSKILKAKRSATMYLANPCDKNEHYPSIYISYEVESWLKELEKEIEDL